MSAQEWSGLNAPKWRDHGIGFGLAIIYFVMLILTSSDVGIPRDESFYLYAGDRAGGWVERLFDGEVESFSRAEIDKGFKYNREHPVLMKLAFGTSHLVFKKKLQWVQSDLLAYRLPTMALSALSLYLAWLLGMMLHSRLAAGVAVAALAFMPRFFFHGHLACFDAPVTFMWLLICYCFLRGARQRRWGVMSGVALGLGLATKLNVFFLPFLLLGVAAMDCYAHKRRTGKWKAGEGERGPLTYYTWIAVSMIVLGAVIFFGHWPWLYYDTTERLGFYISFHARHVHYPVEYLGELLYKPPFPIHFPFVNTVLSVPVGILCLGGIGIVSVARSAWAQFRRPEQGSDRRSAELMVLVNLAFPILLIALPNTPVFGGTKHWMPAMPFLALCAGVGAAIVGKRLFRKAQGWTLTGLTAAVAVFLLLPAVWATARYGDHGPAYYNALAGGASGAADLGMARNFWGYGTVKVLPELNEKVEKRGYVFWHNATNWSIDAYKREGVLRKDIRYSGDWTAEFSNWGVYHHQRQKLPEEVDLWRAYGTDWPVAGYFLDGVQITAVYRRPEPPKRPTVPPGGR